MLICDRRPTYSRQNDQCQILVTVVVFIITEQFNLTHKTYFVRQFSFTDWLQFHVSETIDKADYSLVHRLIIFCYANLLLN